MTTTKTTVRMQGRTPTHQIRASEIGESGLYILEYRRHGVEAWTEERRTLGGQGYITLPKRLRAMGETDAAIAAQKAR